jgi:hypothetical protein
MEAERLFAVGRIARPDQGLITWTIRELLEPGPMVFPTEEEMGPVLKARAEAAKVVSWPEEYSRPDKPQERPTPLRYPKLFY